jgi:hypothetical protein
MTRKAGLIRDVREGQKSDDFLYIGGISTAEGHCIQTWHGSSEAVSPWAEAA